MFAFCLSFVCSFVRVSLFVCGYLAFRVFVGSLFTGCVRIDCSLLAFLLLVNLFVCFVLASCVRFVFVCLLFVYFFG